MMAEQIHFGDFLSEIFLCRTSKLLNHAAWILLAAWWSKMQQWKAQVSVAQSLNNANAIKYWKWLNFGFIPIVVRPTIKILEICSVIIIICIWLNNLHPFWLISAVVVTIVSSIWLIIFTVFIQTLKKTFLCTFNISFDKIWTGIQEKKVFKLFDPETIFSSYIIYWSPNGPVQ